MKPHPHAGHRQYDSALTDAEREAFDEELLTDAELRVKRLRNLAPYSMLQVKPRMSAYMIERLVSIIRRMTSAKGTYRVRELEREHREFSAEVTRRGRQIDRLRGRLELLEPRRQLPPGLDRPA